MVLFVDRWRFPS